MGNLRGSDMYALHVAKTNRCIATCPAQGEAHIWSLVVLGILTTYEDEDYNHDDRN